MKRLGGVWQQLVSFENLLLAYRKARRGKSRRSSVAGFECNLEKELLQLQRELQSGVYQPGNYRLFTIYERKPRQISAAPFRDRVVHHAIMNVIEARIDRSFIDDSYACRHGKGTHAAIDKYQQWAHRYRYVLKMDITRYFPSIDHGLLKQKLRTYMKDQKLLALLERIIDSSQVEPEQWVYFPGDDLFTQSERVVGIPIGNLTSQFFANLYLDDFDHFIKEDLMVKAYLRYVDDMVILADDKARLAELRANDSGHQASGCYVWNGSKWINESGRNWQNPGFTQSDTDPVTCVSYNDAIAYIRWLNNKSGLNYRLPTEAEWEYAARAGSTGDFYWGQDAPGDYAWYADNSENKTHPVGERKPNGFGLYDTAGNAWEWVQDCYENNYKQAPKNGSAWEPQDCTYRVLRGGSWNNDQDDLRSATRDGNNPGSRHNVGFRLAQD
jgi:Sulfatase-modifying factor enzyme 1/Reverse transcriptase (RNA-dependent DNA polymerase)